MNTRPTKGSVVANRTRRKDEVTDKPTERKPSARTEKTGGTARPWSIVTIVA